MVKPIACLLIASIACLSVVAQDEIPMVAGLTDSLSAIIHLTSKLVVKSKAILLQWSAGTNNSFYIIERSVDLAGFEVIGAIKADLFKRSFEFVDEKPSGLKNYYRIKSQGSDETIVYSDTITAGSSDPVFCKFYPNPVDKLLIVRSDYSAALKITDITGNTRISQKLKPGVQVLDLSCLERSIYIITIFQEESKQFITRKLIKN